MLKRCCDVCGNASEYMHVDQRLKNMFGIKADVCISCSGWLSDAERYERLCDNGIISEDIYEALVREKEEVL